MQAPLPRLLPCLPLFTPLLFTPNLFLKHFINVWHRCWIGFVLSEIWNFLPILSRRLLGAEEKVTKFQPSSRYQSFLSNPCQDVGMIPGDPYRINQVSWQLRLITGSPPASLQWGEKGRRPKGPDRHARPCKVRAYLRPPPAQSFLLWLGDEAQNFVTSRHKTGIERVGRMAWPQW